MLCHIAALYRLCCAICSTICHVLARSSLKFLPSTQSVRPQFQPQLCACLLSLGINHIRIELSLWETSCVCSSFGHVPPLQEISWLSVQLFLCNSAHLQTQTLMINGVYSLPFLLLFIFIFRKLEGFKVLCFVLFLKMNLI